jgi:hypothetical protein
MEFLPDPGGLLKRADALRRQSIASGALPAELCGTDDDWEALLAPDRATLSRVRRRLAAPETPDLADARAFFARESTANLAVWAALADPPLGPDVCQGLGALGSWAAETRAPAGELALAVTVLSRAIPALLAPVERPPTNPSEFQFHFNTVRRFVFAQPIIERIASDVNQAALFIALGKLSG